MDVDKLIAKIKNYLIDETDSDYETWQEFVDTQRIGDCQGIVASICIEFPKAKKVFGEVEVDTFYIDKNGDTQTMIAHHWVEICGVIYDFSKGTLKDYIDWDDIYEVDSSCEAYRYNPISG